MSTVIGNLPFFDSHIIHQYTVTQSNFVLYDTIGTNECVLDGSLLTDNTFLSNCTRLVYLFCFHFTVGMKSISYGSSG